MLKLAKYCRNGSINNLIQDPSLVDGKEIEIKLSDSVSHMQKLNNPDSNMENLSAMNNSQPQFSSTMLDASDESCTDMQSGKVDSPLHNEVKKETPQNSVDCFRELHESTFVPVDGCTEDSSTSYGEGGFPVDHVHNDAECVNPINSEISSSELSCQTSFSKAVEVSPQANSGNISPHQIANDDDANPSSPYQVNVSCPNTSVNFMVDEKLENLSLNELNKAVVGEVVGEDESAFLSALHEIGDAFPSDLGKLEPDLEVSDHSRELESVLPKSPSNSLSNEVDNDLSVAMDKTGYDPSLWTPMEIETATGNPDCTLLEHPLMLSSTYAEVKVDQAFTFALPLGTLFEVLNCNRLFKKLQLLDIMYSLLHINDLQWEVLHFCIFAGLFGNQRLKWRALSDQLQ